MLISNLNQRTRAFGNTVIQKIRIFILSLTQLHWIQNVDVQGEESLSISNVRLNDKNVQEEGYTVELQEQNQSIETFI
ncbi:unnamed protein product (macronuclear) [Paramecium tetraurelia]|uniref:Uncharacterized protein n=1 Tax=Paramecium tetraurelia TaxID=5888 RepID=A0DVZ4_PARTE|nr:uncharacterized protein GSPATT00020864001 [Paramecium tetraurelia]CAK87211.1 unnamed protein product [Paramecium tetraurelia]|eukprot:XP_001454608.1 hypothetical protein (macronuclear) [Paramecium tetraurelia strain d4-2]